MGLKEHIKQNFLILDGAMGTMLQKAGLELGHIPEVLNITAPDKITDIHKQYVDAGSDMVLSCTFGANERKLDGCGYEVEEIISVAVQNAKNSGAKFVALDVGPIGELLAPTGTLSFDKAYEMFARQIIAGAHAGVDAIYIETMTDLLEVKAAILAAKEHSDLPVFVTMTFEEGGRTFLGVPASVAAITLEALGVDALGLNCSLGPVQLIPIAREIAKYSSIPLIVKPNAGLPVVDGDSFSYDITPDQFTDTLKTYIEEGFTILGGCCGTTPVYIEKIKELLSSYEFSTRNDKKITAVCSSTKLLECNQVCIIGERINPTGKKKFREALKNHDLDYIIDQAMEQIDAGAHILDVNVGTPDIDEVQMMLEVTSELQSIVDVPLQIDSSNPIVIEKALRVYNGIPIINSVNGEKKSLDAILPLAAKYGAPIVGLTLDENGIPTDADGRFKIAEKIVNEAKKYGIPAHKILIDCLTLTVSAEPDGALETLRAVKMVKEQLGVKTVLGVSNISFGLPEREKINAHFLALALHNGLDFAIINPNVAVMTDAVDIHNLLHKHDLGGDVYISRHTNEKEAVKVDIPESELTAEYAILKGLANETGKITEKLLQDNSELDVIANYLIPALDKVGELYEQGKMFLPQLIRSAEAAKSGFSIIRSRLQDKNDPASSSKGKVVLATVKGDIHDIGKNIVKVVMENYGYTMIDLGRDVAIEKVVEAAREHNAPLVGLSALMTTTLTSMQETIIALRNDGFAGKIMVGGAVLTPEYAMQIGADFYAKDAKASVDIAKTVIG